MIPLLLPWCPLLPGALHPCRPSHTCVPCLHPSLLQHTSSRLCHRHTSAVLHWDGRFRCATWVNQGQRHRQFNLHQLSPSTLKNSGPPQVQPTVHVLAAPQNSTLSTFIYSLLSVENYEKDEKEVNCLFSQVYAAETQQHRLLIFSDDRDVMC